ncbi:MAG TPA: hypothetical protein PL124_12305 [Candidatus Cloacimonadota bacterium]|nr:hypothetical protein [Candidatus Cloacimonadota bacterium]HPS40192.1 hypothetical protein [Candidatus Cloacimonadota bacterium]
MIHKTPQKELEYVLGVVKRVQNCVDSENRFNHDAMCYLPDLIEISKKYAIILHESLNPLVTVPVRDSGKCHECGAYIGRERHADRCVNNPMHMGCRL